MLAVVLATGLFHPAVAHAGSVTVNVPCEYLHSFNTTRQISKWYGTHQYTKEYYFGTGRFNLVSYYASATTGDYEFGDIRSSDNLGILQDAIINSSCYRIGNFGPPYADTVWTDFYTQNHDGGTFVPLIQADDSDCTEIIGDCGGEGGGGGGDPSVLCYYRILADENGNPYVDANGNWVIIDFLGCF